MHYLIDGYNFLFACIDSKKDLRSQRQTVIADLQQKFATLDLEGTIVFDGSQPRGEQSGLSYKSPLIIAYSFAGETADQYIIEKIEGCARPSELTLVTNDKMLSFTAKNHKAHVMEIKTFLRFLEKKHARRQDPDQKLTEETTWDFNRLLKIFEERDSKESD